MVYSGAWGNLFIKKPEVENLMALSFFMFKLIDRFQLIKLLAQKFCIFLVTLSLLNFSVETMHNLGGLAT
jgi:hypothetical protein